jgi:PAS domain-containing protein
VLKNRDLKRKVLINTIAAAVYFALAVLTSPASSNLSQNSLSNRLLICPVSGLEIAASILIGPYLWPGISLAALGAAVFKGFSLPGALLAAAAHGLGVTLSALAVRRWIKSSNPFQNMRSVLIYTILVVFLISALMSGLRAASISLSLNLWSQFLPLYASLWISTIAGFLVLTPFVLVWADRSNLPDWDIVRISRLAVNLTVLGLITWATFSAEIILPSSDHLHLGLVIIPLVILTASLFGLHGAVSATLTVALISTLFDLQGVHLFAASRPHFSTLFLQGYQSVIAVTGLLSAAALVERDRALQKSRQMHATQQAFLKNTGVWLSLSDAAGRITAWSKGAEQISGYSGDEVIDKELIWPLLHAGQPEKDHFWRELKCPSRPRAGKCACSPGMSTHSRTPMTPLWVPSSSVWTSPTRIKPKKPCARNATWRKLWYQRRPSSAVHWNWRKSSNACSHRRCASSPVMASISSCRKEIQPESSINLATRMRKLRT